MEGAGGPREALPSGGRSEAEPPRRMPNQAEDIADGLGYHVVFGRAWTIWNALDLGNALLSRWPVVASENWPLPVLEGADESRALLYALVDAPFGRLPVFVTHLSWRFHEGAQRALQVRAVDDRAAEVAPPASSLPAVLMGDFNAEPDSDEIRFLRGLTALGGRSTYWADCFGLVGEGAGLQLVAAERVRPGGARALAAHRLRLQPRSRQEEARRAAGGARRPRRGEGRRLAVGPLRRVRRDLGLAEVSHDTSHLL